MTYNRLLTIPTVLLLYGTTLCAQTTWEVDLYGRTQKNIGGVRKGSDIHISSVNWFRTGDANATAICRDFDHFELGTDDRMLIPRIDKNFKDAIKFNCVTVQDVWDAAIIDNILDRIREKGYQYNQRQEMEMRGRRYEKILRDHSLVYDDPQLMLYLQRINRRIRPQHLPDARTFHYDLMVIQSPASDSFMLPNGTLVLTTGLLTLLHTPDELAAVMIRETAHLILDHALANYHKSHLSQIVLGAVTTLVSDVINSFTGFSISGSTDYYSQGTATTSDVSLVDGIMTSAVNELGLSYSVEQDAVCDAITLEVLGTSGYDTDALATVLARQGELMRSDRRYVRTLKHYEPGDMERRSESMGTAHTDISSSEYEKALAPVTTIQAQILYNEHRFLMSETLSRQNIRNGIYTDDDCIILASSLLAVHDSDEAAEETLKLTDMARKKRPENIQAFKPAILALIRLGRNPEAGIMLTEYGSSLDVFMNSKENVRGTDMWELAYQWVENEKAWIRKTKASIDDSQQTE